MMSLLRRVGRLQLVLIITTLSTILLLLVHMYSEIDQSAQYNYRPPPRQIRSSYNYDAGRLSDAVFYDHNMPLIWVGGVPRSGTTLARVMLDAHPDIRCGEETRIIPRLLAMHGHLAKSEKEMARLKEAKITEDIMDEALGAYLLNIIIKHGEPAQRLCNKDPFALKSIPKLLKIFPNSKFVLMARDGRATVHSIISRKVTIRGFDTKSYRGALRDWNRAIETMYTHCQMVGPRSCLVVKYEDLVLHPEGQMKKLLSFLGVPWNSLVLHHEETVGKNGGASLSRKEPSTDQVRNPVNTGSLTTWVDSIPDDLRQDMESVAPMLSRLGYDPTGYPPDYGTPDKIVQRQSASIELELKAKKILHLKNDSGL